MSDDDTQPIHHRPPARHGSGLHERVANTTTQLDRIERNLERSLTEIRELDRHVLELRVMLEHVSKRIEEVRAEHDRRLEAAAKRHSELARQVTELDQVAKLHTKAIEDLEERVDRAPAPQQTGISVKGAATLTGGAGALGAGIAEFLRWLSSLGGGT